MYAWVSANYALGTLHGDQLQTTGIIELGGASAQVVSQFCCLIVFFSRAERNHLVDLHDWRHLIDWISPLTKREHFT